MLHQAALLLVEGGALGAQEGDLLVGGVEEGGDLALLFFDGEPDVDADRNKGHAVNPTRVPFQRAQELHGRRQILPHLVIGVLPLFIGLGGGDGSAGGAGVGLDECFSCHAGVLTIQAGSSLKGKTWRL